MSDNFSNNQNNDESGLKILFENLTARTRKKQGSAGSGGENIFISDFVNWQPFYDLYVTGEKMIITIEIAGVRVRDIAIYAAKTFMVIDGIRRSPEKIDKNHCTFHNLEIPYGRFNRRIDFPWPVEPRKCQYRIENGILTITLPIMKERIIPIEES